MNKPLIGVSSDCVLVDCFTPPQPYHRVHAQYTHAVVEKMNAIPVVIPNVYDKNGRHSLDIAGVLDRLDGLLMTGSRSNVGAEHYGQNPNQTPNCERDNNRDNITLNLIREAVARAMPLLCICRGHQELNVALGGTLQRDVHKQNGNFAHHPAHGTPYDDEFRIRQDITLSADGVLAGFNGGNLQSQVNSVHGQAIDGLSPKLTVEAVSTTDGIVEAVRIADYPTFGMGIQWHPEHHNCWDNALTQPLFDAFRKSAVDYRT